MYKIPSKIKELITNNFLEQFIEEMHMITGLAIDMFGWDHLFNYESTGAWNAAFFSACDKTNNYELLTYYRKLGWEDGDLFDDTILDLLEERKMILAGLESDEIAKRLGIDEKQIYYCYDCGQYFKEEDMTYFEDDEDKCLYVCKKCEKNIDVTPLKYDVLTSLKEYINIDSSDIFYCESCGHYHLNKFKTNNGICKYCEIQNKSENKNANNYYQECLKLEDRIRGKK